MQQSWAQMPISQARSALTHLEDLNISSPLIITRHEAPYARLELLQNQEKLFKRVLSLLDSLPQSKSRKKRISRNYKKYLV